MNEQYRIAERQYGIVTRVQLTQLGLTANQIEHRVRMGQLEAIYPRVYRVVGSVRSHRQLAMGACLWLAPDAVLSHTSAASLLRLDGRWPETLHLSVPTDERRGRSRRELIVHRTSTLGRRRRIVDSIPCTSAARTIVDCAPLLDDEGLESAFESARRMGLATIATVRRALRDAGTHRRGATALHRVLEQADARALESRLEVKLARLLRTSTLPPSVPQYHVGDYRLDRAWPESRVGIEADGFQFHGRRFQWKRDRRRAATIEAAGWRLIHVTWEDLTETPRRTLDRLAIALGILAA
jgi:very-short-patch-repair endonuclease